MATIEMFQHFWSNSKLGIQGAIFNRQGKLIVHAEMPFKELNAKICSKTTTNPERIALEIPSFQKSISLCTTYNWHYG